MVTVAFSSSLEFTTRAALYTPGAPAVKLRSTEQLAPAATVVQLLVCRKSAALAPSRAMLLICRAALPLLAMVTCADSLVPDRTRPSSTDSGDTEISGVGARVPRPDRATSMLGVSASVESMVRVALRVPSLFGARVSCNAEDASGVRQEAHRLYTLLTSASLPLMAMLFRP